ncbi:hypothetical protein QRQ56_24175 [Bradyrhizobium sp. U531]
MRSIRFTRAGARRDALGSASKAGPLHLAAIMLMHVACMSLIVWLSL